MSTIVAPSDSSSQLQESSPTVRRSNVQTSSSTTVATNPNISAPFDAIRRLSDYLREHPEAASALNAHYPKRGILKTGASPNATSDQNVTIDLSLAQAALIPAHLREILSRQGLNEILTFFENVSNNASIGPILYTLSILSGTNMASVHKNHNFSFRLCDYNHSAADPDNLNSCGTHTDFGTFSIVFQDGTPGLEIEDANAPGTWHPVSGTETVVLTGWCALVLSGGRIPVARHRVRCMPGVRRLSAVLYVAPDAEVKLMPLNSTLREGGEKLRPFSRKIMSGEVSVEWFKKVMGKRWRYRVGNEVLDEGHADHASMSQDSEIEKLVWG
ncbi:uncharacterized protein BHQ10_008000 [Talaromyces amestolkiae]|uniref:Isopenicillin N synthase-like Fe(2+) 2OG dioxygenase domain-containing protein n=1 Tax=Talaromyces amestolkiae TaxID=1196081 RepID=A0A364L844_TALAM|nr:uncharacterized protein BHQ10_008000 [Talaromyces amestolkiae]RAO71988.1 hypothetical protein BHQ10_008000 [Talaromyces amestolkiae]